MDAQEEETGERPSVLLMSKATFNMIKNSDRVRNTYTLLGVLSSNLSTDVNITTNKIKAFVEEELNVSIVVYNKMFKDESGTAKKFYPDNIVMMLPSGALGKTWFGTAPEERTLSSKASADVSVVETGIAVAVTITDDPVNTKTTVSEIALPSFERMDDCYALEVADSE